MKRIINQSELSETNQNKSMKILSVNDMLKIRGGDQSNPDPKGLK
jgi:hypothetical protein